MASVEEMLRRKALAAVAVLAGLAVTSCGGGGAAEPSVGHETPGQATGAPKPATPPRTGPAKATALADKCAVVTEEQWRELGADKAPRERTSNGKPGCQYQKGDAGAQGWGVFVAVSDQTSFEEQVQKRSAPTKTTDLGGYPAAEYQSKLGCVLFAGVSDRGFVISNALSTSTADPGVDMCQQAEKFAQAAIQNLPNA
ncbi:hypothetical protein GCM10025787_33830 [Saccharopolyspora rosea]|uniref:DUF3558 domain-containing protein n=1 Tax=Saccharopolyspora rosea TaxID=524884 RepID=A0ABW3FYT3_9PSEU